MKRKYFLLLALPLLLVTSCDNSQDDDKKPTPDPVLSFSEVYNKLSKELTLSGTVKEVLVGENKEETPLNGTIKVNLGENSYHIEQTGDCTEIISSIYTNDEENRNSLHYYITELNEVEYEVITEMDEELQENVPVPFKEYENPFKYVKADVFKDNGDNTYSFDMSKTESLNDLYYMSGNIIYLMIDEMAAQFETNVIEDFTFTREKNDLTKLHIKTINLSDSFGTRYFEYNFNIDYSSDVDHDYPLPSPLPHEDYHTNLDKAFDALKNETYVAEGSVDWGGIAYPFTYAISDDLVYVYDEGYDEFVAFVKLDDGIHEVSSVDGTYHYKPDIVEDGEAYWPTQTMATEWFNFDEDTDAYFLEGDTSCYNFSSGMIPYAYLFDPTAFAGSELNITLDDNDMLKTLTVTGGIAEVTINFNFDNPVLPIDVSKITEEPTLFERFLGTYTFTDDGAENVVVVTENSVTFNGESCLDIGENRYGELEFTYKDENWSINKDKSTIYNNDSGASFAFTYSA